MDVKLAVPIPYTRAGYSRYYDWTDYKIACAGCMFHHASALARKYLLQSQRKVVMAPKEFEMKYSGFNCHMDVKFEINNDAPASPCPSDASFMHRSEVITGDEIGTVRQ